MSFRFASISIALLLASSAMAQPAASLKAEQAKLSRADRAYKSAKASFEKDKSNAKKRKSYIDATVAFGTVVMNSGALAPRQKYPRALNLYREALKLDPKNKEALANKKMIEDIYRQMGRPIPK